MLVKPGTATATEQNSYKFMETNSEVKEGDPVSALTEGKPLTWAPLVGTNSMSSCVASITTHTMFDTRTQSSESCEFCHSQDGKHKEKKKPVLPRASPPPHVEKGGENPSSLLPDVASSEGKAF